MVQSTISEHISVTPGMCGGRAHISGHRIRVQDIVIWHERLGLAPDEIVTEHPEISLSDVYAALAYYHDHVDEISVEINDDDALARSLQTSTSSKLLEKISRRRG